MTSGPLDWAVLGHHWPHREHSRFLHRGGIRWHVQVQGSGPALLLLHGTGASGHSFRDLVPLLASRFTVIVPDLPGHAFSTVPPRFVPSLPAIAAALEELLAELRLEPEVVVGHSAGAAVMARLALDGAPRARLLVGVGAALVPFRGVAGAFFLPAARLLARSSLASRLIALQAGDTTSVERMVRGTGSRIDARGVELYRLLASSSAHVGSVLAMMASWDLGPLFEELPALGARLLLLAGASDRAIPLAQQREVAARVPGSRLVVLPDLGHLLHEEQPQAVARFLLG